MESTNLHHHQHQLQEQLVHSSPLPTPFGHGFGSLHALTPTTTVSSGNLGGMVNSRDPKQHSDILFPSLSSCMTQDLGFHWASTDSTSNSSSPTGSFTINNRSAHDLQDSRIKQELSDCYPKFTEMINNPIARSIDGLHLQDFPAGDFYSNPPNGSKGKFSQIFPTINVSNFNQSAATISNSLGMNLEALDFLNSTTFSGCYSQPLDNRVEFLKDSISNYSLDHMQQLCHRPSTSPCKKSPFTEGVTEAKRPSTFMESKEPQQTPKKSRSDSRVSCPPLKVRKEKLGDRIAALQQLVAPFGKTDTASVLMEAIGYVNFLHNQVENLSVPYMKSTRNKPSRTVQMGLTKDGQEEPKRDLRSRGLCLVPLSCLSYVTDGGGGIWPPSTFISGGT